LINPLMLFLSAGTINWPRGWFLSGLTVLLTILNRYGSLVKHPDLARERVKSLKAKGVKSWDRILSLCVGLFGGLSIFLTAGLDKRFGWSPPVANWITLAAMAAALAGFALSSWALIENKYFSSVVRIQTDRGHTVCASGPYRFIRHPGYAGAILYFAMFPVFLSRLWPLLPALLTIILIVLRTHLEDRTLINELPGYREYTNQVQYRLIPRIW
jgi:protein-S-isoprenylcysteine O-methyltransferase Ste14